MPKAASRGFALALLLAAKFAFAGLFDDEEARKQIAELKQQVGALNQAMDERVAALEAALKAQGLVDLLNQVESLKSDMAKLRGQIEVMNYEIEQAQKRQRDLYIDLDTRLRKLETPPEATAAVPPTEAGPATAAPAVKPSSEVATPSADAPSPTVTPTPMPKLPPTRSIVEAGVTPEQQTYATAQEHFQSGRYTEALALYQTFLKAFPKSPLAPSAQYWIGNSYYAQRDYGAAIVAHGQLLRNYPDSQKVPDALLNIASAQAEQSDQAAARKTMDDLIARYPQSEAAEKARKRLAATR